MGEKQATLEFNLDNVFNEVVAAMEMEWDLLGLSEEARVDRKYKLFEWICESCKSIVADEKAKRVDIEKTIEKNKLEVLQLCNELDIECKDAKGLSMLETWKFYEDQLEGLNKLREERLLELNKLIDEDKVLCDYLMETPLSMPVKTVPTESDLQQLMDHIKEMKSEKENRISSYIELREDIVDFVQLLEKPLTSFVPDICESVDNLHCLSKAYIQDIRKLHSDLEAQTRELESRSLELRETIASLWVLLHILVEERNSFLSTVPVHVPSCIVKLEEEVMKLKETRKQNLKSIIDDLKLQLHQWWGMCYVGEETIQMFLETQTEVTEEVLEECESELKKWKEYYSSNSHILKRVNDFLNLFDKMQQLDEKAKDPTRLFNTRGGTLLLEERDRKRVKSELPNVQSQLIEMGMEYEAKTGKQFLIDGKSIEEYLNYLWSFYGFQKEKERTRIHNKNKLHDTLSKKAVKQMGNILSGECRPKRMREDDDFNSQANVKRAANVLGKTYTNIPQPSLKCNKNVIQLAASVPRGSAGKKSHPDQSLLSLHSQGDVIPGSISYDTFKESLQTRTDNVNSTTASQPQATTEDNV